MPLCALSASPLRHLTPALPLEIIDYIIDFLWNDRTTLQACSLTSRAFRREAQLHLFWSLNIGKATTDSCPRLRAFKTHEGLASLIRHISYVEDQQDCSWDDLASSLPSHLSSNTRPRTAYFAVRYNPTAVNRPRVSSHEVPLDPFTSPLWSNLHTLTLRGVTFQDCGHFGRAILPLRGLKVLELDPVAINPYCDGAPVIGPEFDGVCALRISFVGMSSLAAILPWLAAGAARGNVALQAVSVPLLLGDNTALLQLLWYFARSLTMLRLVSAANAGGTLCHAEIQSRN
ncbi:hypothetical protein BKA62DRAFT_822117 [Auriculariales sp. MPI-PUGE-AT-0066]|nr:hypothetical protein BKA62DRAFT_822117 [Auriculariales sp. MPI-PUGE-AT-0066]